VLGLLVHHLIEQCYQLLDFLELLDQQLLRFQKLKVQRQLIDLRQLVVELELIGQQRLIDLEQHFGFDHC
jgi:hypothetical protein